MFVHTLIILFILCVSLSGRGVNNKVTILKFKLSKRRLCDEKRFFITTKLSSIFDCVRLSWKWYAKSLDYREGTNDCHIFTDHDQIADINDTDIFCWSFEDELHDFSRSYWREEMFELRRNGPPMRYNVAVTNNYIFMLDYDHHQIRVRGITNNSIATLSVERIDEDVDITGLAHNIIVTSGGISTFYILDVSTLTWPHIKWSAIMKTKQSYNKLAEMTDTKLIAVTSRSSDIDILTFRKFKIVSVHRVPNTKDMFSSIISIAGLNREWVVVVHGNADTSRVSCIDEMALPVWETTFPNLLKDVVVADHHAVLVLDEVSEEVMVMSVDGQFDCVTLRLKGLVHGSPNAIAVYEGIVFVASSTSVMGYTFN